MPPKRFLSISEQVSAHLRDQISRGRWVDTMPGMNQLAVELGINSKTAETALQHLERSGLLVSQGPGRRRRIALPEAKTARPMRVVLLHHEPDDRKLDYVVELKHALAEAGHTVINNTKTLRELGMEEGRIRRLVRQVEADAWVVEAGSREVLEWFCAQPVPTFALFGRREGLPMAAAGPDKPQAMAATARHLIGLGHRRIAFLTRRIRRFPEPGKSEEAFLQELRDHGIATGSYNLPNWDEDREGFQQLLNAMFKVTPPTALIIDEAPFFVAAQMYLASNGIRVPQQVSLVSTDPDLTFAWCTPTIAHIRWDPALVVRRIVRWAANVSRGRVDLKQTLFPAEFVTGGTVGPAPAVSSYFT